MKSYQVFKEKRLSRSSKKKLNTKRIENLLMLELTEKLETYLKDNDRVMLEINPRVAGEFVSILNDKILSVYDYEQVDKNKFIFSNKEIRI